MTTTNPTFLRRFEVFVAIARDASAPVLEPVQITLGFRGPVDPESGMVFNLTEVDAWIKKFTSNLNKKSHASRWNFCRHIKTKFTKLINRSEFVDLYVAFHDWGVHFKNGSVFLKWTRQSSLITSKRLKWLSPVTLTMKVLTAKSLPLSKAMDAKMSDSLRTIRLEKLNWTLTGLAYSSFEYIDPKLECSLRV